MSGRITHNSQIGENMAEQIRGHMETQQDGTDWYVTTVGWTVPDAGDDEAFVRAFTKRFEKELRDTIQAHRKEE